MKNEIEHLKDILSRLLKYGDLCGGYDFGKIRMSDDEYDAAIKKYNEAWEDAKKAVGYVSQGAR